MKLVIALTLAGAALAGCMVVPVGHHHAGPYWDGHRYGSHHRDRHWDGGHRHFRGDRWQRHHDYTPRR